MGAELIANNGLRSERGMRVWYQSAEVLNMFGPERLSRDPPLMSAARTGVYIHVAEFFIGYRTLNMLASIMRCQVPADKGTPRMEP